MKKNRGFTLIELLVVTAIIAVLSAIMFPVFAQAKAKARQINCLANLKQFGTSFSMYLGDWDNRYPYTSFPTGAGMTMGADCVGTSTTGNWFNLRDENWLQKLEPYIKYELVADVGGVGRPQGIMRCKDVERAWQVTLYAAGTPDRASYGYNFLYLGLPFLPYHTAGTPPNDYNFNPYQTGVMGSWVKGAARQSSIVAPDETLLLVENATIWAFPPCMSNGSYWMASGGKYIRPRHNGKSDVLFCDGHVTSVETRTLIGRGVRFGNMGKSEIGIARNNSMWDLR